MFVKNLPPALLEGFGEVTDSTDEIEMIFEDHDIYAVVRELPLKSSRYWLFEIGAENALGTLVLRSTPFAPLGHTVDQAAERAELMITYQGRAPVGWTPRNGEIRDDGLVTGQLWTEYAEYGEPSATDTEPQYTDSDDDDEWVDRSFDDKDMAN